MPTFQYQALDSGGRKKKGFIEADSQARAFTQLQDQDLMPVSLAPVGEKFSTSGRLAELLSLVRLGGMKIGEPFFYLGLLLQSGTSLAHSLDLLGRMSGRRHGRVWLNIRDAVERGESFSQALKEYPRIFPAVYIGMIQVAEGVGRLGAVLERIAEYEEQRSEVSGRILTALVYPCVIMVIGMGAVYFLLSQVLPDISRIFTSAGQELPLTTTVLLGIGVTLRALGPAALLPPVLLILLAVMAYRRLPVVHRRVDRMLWRVPLVQKTILARFSGMLGFQLEAGIPLVRALQSSSEAVASRFFRDIVAEARKEVAAGQPLDRVLERQGVFPDVYLLTLSTGQRAGKLAPFLLRMARIYERDVDNILKRIVALAEPLLILFIGLSVGFIVLAILGPIFELTTLVR